MVRAADSIKSGEALFISQEQKTRYKSGLTKNDVLEVNQTGHLSNHFLGDIFE